MTIVALSSGSVPSGIAVIRASGPDVRFGLETFVGIVPEPRRALVRKLRDVSGDVLDEAVVLFFPGPASFTGEDVVEFQVHGGRAVVNDVLSRLSALPGWRLAEPGEFTRRAVEHGRLDLTGAEAIADLIGAETTAQRRLAIRSRDLESESIRWRNELLDAAALIEAEVDFPDEGDVPALLEEARGRVQRILASVQAALRGADRAERLRTGVTVVIAGPPNAGKSALLNALSRRDVAIVSPYAGTTRDAIEVRLDLSGYPVTLVDTAGIRDSEDPVERIGIARSREWQAEADLVLWLVPPDGDAAEAPGGAVLVASKADLAMGAIADAAVSVSAVTGVGMDQLLGLIERATRERLAGAETAIVSRIRHRQELRTVVEHLERAAAGPFDSAPELFAEEVRLALRALGRLTGRVDIDEIFDRIFSSFCIGK